MISYYDELSEEDRLRVTESVQTLYKQTFLLERKYDKKLGRFLANKEYNECAKHLEFIRSYFKIMEIDVVENTQLGLIYISGEQLIGEKLPKLATLYLLVMKLIYDEQMTSASTSMNVYTNLSELHEKLASYGLILKQPTPTEIRRALQLLKKHQVIEPLDVLEYLDGTSRMIIYPTVNAVLFGDDVRLLISTFKEDAKEDSQKQGEEIDTLQGKQEYGPNIEGDEEEDGE